MLLEASGPCMVYARDVTGPAFEPVHPAIPIVQLGNGHSIRLVIHFNLASAHTHARYSPCFAVGMEHTNDPDTFILQFGSNDHRSPTTLLHEALDHLSKRIDRTLQTLSDDKHIESYI